MIIFDLNCSAGHHFEGWFRSVDEFSSQLAQGIVCCPHCHTSDVRRLPSAVHLGSAGTAAPRNESPTMPSPVAVAKAFVEHLLAHSEDVGSAFADEARRIHYHEAPARTIRGQATADERAALRDEGIDVMAVPHLKPEDLN